MTEGYALPDLAVLVADASLHQRRLLKQLLLQVRVRRVFEAADGRSVLRGLIEQRPDILLLDWDLPDWGGAEVLRLVRLAKGSPRPQLPVVVTAARPRHATILRMAAAGANEVVLKPVAPKLLWQRIRRAAMMERAFVVEAGIHRLLPLEPALA